MSGFTAILARDLALVLRRPGDVTVVLAFFVVATTLFPLGIGPEANLLSRIAAGILWCAALFAAMLSLDFPGEAGRVLAQAPDDDPWTR